MNVKIDALLDRERPVIFSGPNTLTLQFENQIASLQDVQLFPGIFNAHDHLEFNLFPRMGENFYPDYKHWGAAIHKKNKDTIKSIVNIPVDIRIRFGIFKNLINGVTHVVHHGGHVDFIKTIDYPVFLNYQYIHALETEPFWKFKLNSFSKRDIILHIGEGTSKDVGEEISRLLRWNVMRRNLIGIHAIGMTAAESKNFKSVVWCPLSNMNLYGATANVEKLKKTTTILFGTDSTLTGSANFWEHLRLARSLGKLDDSEFFDMVINRPRQILWPNAPNSFVVAKKKSLRGWDDFFDLNPEDILLVAINDAVRLVDASLISNPGVEFSHIQVGQAEKFIMKSDADVLTSLREYAVSIPLNVSLI